MIKLLAVATRRAGMPVPDFQSYWREVHGPLVARVPGLRQYVQTHALPELYGGDFAPDFDGAAELAFDDLAAYQRALASEDWQAVRADGANFMESARKLIVRDIPILGDYPSPRDRVAMVKYMGFLTRKAE